MRVVCLLGRLGYGETRRPWMEPLRLLMVARITDREDIINTRLTGRDDER